VLDVKILLAFAEIMLALLFLLAYANNVAFAGIKCRYSMNDEPKPSGRAVGGRARMEKLSPEERRDQAKSAAAARWSKKDVLRATHGSADRPLIIGGMPLDCYVLEDGTRVVSQRSMIRALGLTRGGARHDNELSRIGAQLPRFAALIWLKPFLGNDLELALSQPILFQPQGGTSYGYPATILADICDAILRARDAKATGPRQANIVQQADILVRGFARVGIIALVDEATGYQEDRARDALAQILEAFIAKELQPYVQTFPADFYKEMFRLRGLTFPGSVKRPQYFGMLTNDVVYKRLAPGVLNELKRIKVEQGKPRDKLFQRLTANIGYPKLREHLGSVVTIMTFSDNWHDFMSKLNRRHPRYGDQMELPLDYRQDKDTGRGL
jgi:hypothetical protein